MRGPTPHPMPLVAETKAHRDVRVRFPGSCLACRAPIPRTGRRRYCSDVCRQAARRARRNGDPQALFDRWCALVDPVDRFRRAYEESQRIERDLWVKHAINPHRLIDRLAEEAEERLRPVSSAQAASRPGGMP